MDRSQPFIEVSVDGRPVSDFFYSRLNQATIQDAPGQESDTAELTFDDAGNGVAMPAKGALIEVRFGYRGSGVEKMGLFTFDKSRIAGGEDGEKLVLICGSADMRQDVKEARSEHFDETTIGGLVEELAGRHGYGAKVSPAFSGTAMPYAARFNQSTADFLTRLADRHGALFSVKGGKFLFVERGQLPVVTIDKGECESWSFDVEPRPRFGEVEAGWFDPAKNRTVYERFQTGLEGPVKRLRTTFASAAEAEAAARADAGRLGRATGSGSITLEGRPDILADQPIVATGFRAEASGLWRAGNVTHAFGDSYKTTVPLDAPEEGKS